MTSVEKYQSMLRVDDRPSAGMVTTPVELANEMIDRLPNKRQEEIESKLKLVISEERKKKNS